MEQFTLKIAVPAEHIRNVFGEYDSYVRKIERELLVTIVNRDEGITLVGAVYQTSLEGGAFSF